MTIINKSIDKVIESLKHGKWIEMCDNYGHSSYFCSRCGTQEGKVKETCPNCGAEMEVAE